MCLLVAQYGSHYIVGYKCILPVTGFAKRTKTMTTKTLNDHLNWRYATKKMDPAKAVPQDKVEAIIERDPAV